MILKSSIIETIKALPPLPVTIIEINSIYADKNSTIKDMAKAIEKDPMIVANILKAANSPLYGFGRDIKNVTQAVALFGINMIRSIAIGNSIRKLLNFVDMIRYSDDPSLAPSDIKEYATALNIIKTIVPLNKPFSEISINLGVKTALDSLYDTALLQDSIKQVMSLK
jgi:HD-like signal output (HDOD) protein